MHNDQIKQTYQGVFDRSAATYDTVGPSYFAHFGQRLVEFARIPVGARVLDIACGRGAVLFPASAAVGLSGEVIGIDFSTSMVAATEHDITARELANAHVLQMDAEHLNFPDGSFDMVLCGFALFFFPDLNQALAEMRRVLKPGGQIAVSTWGSNRDKRWEWLGKLFEAYVPSAPEAAAAEKSRPTLDFGTPFGMTEILTGAGFRNLRTSTETQTFAFRTEADWWAASWSHGGRLGLETVERSVGADGLERFKAEAFANLQAFRTTDGFPEQFEVIYTSGAKD